MKHHGQTLSRYTGTVTIVRTVGKDLEQLKFTIQQLPSTWAEECERLLPPPEPPIVGKEKDAAGNWVPKHDPDDKKYRAEFVTWQKRTKAKKIYDATLDGAEWETDPALLESDPRAFYDGIYAELDAALSGGEIATYLMKINGIDMVGGADVALAEESLFQQIIGSTAIQSLEEIATRALGADDGPVRGDRDLLGEGVEPDTGLDGDPEE